MGFGQSIQKFRCMGHGATHSGRGSVQVRILFFSNPERERKTIFLASLFCPPIRAPEETTESIKPSHVISATETVMEGII